MSFDHRLSTSAFIILIGFSLATTQAAPAGASVGFQPISTEELKMHGEMLAPGAPAVILFRQVDRDDNGKTSHEDNYLRIKILTEEGRKYGDVEIPYERGWQGISGLRARTIKADGTVVNFDGKVFDKTIVKARGVKYLAKTFTLPEVNVGSIIEYYYTVNLKEDYLFDSHWILSHELFTRSARFTLKPYYGRDQRFNLHWVTQRLPPAAAPPQEGDDRVVRLTVDDIPAFPTEDMMPPANELKSRVDFIYSTEAPQHDVEKFWQLKGKKLNAQVEAFVGKRKAMEQAVAGMVAPNDSPEVKLEKIYARVQQLRNTSYEVGKTEQEQRRGKEKEARSVEEVWKSGYGNGFELTWLFLALARAAGCEAYGVLASDRRNYFFNPRLMDTSRLDSNVVLVKLDGKDVYFDPGGAFTPFGMLEWSETGVKGLKLDKDGGSWVDTTLPASSDSRIERRANLNLSDTGDLEGKLTVTFTGLEGLRRRVEERHADETERKRFLEEEVKGFIPVASEVELVNKPEWAGSAPALVAEFKLKVPGWASSAGRRALVPVGLFGASEKHLFDHDTRVHPIYLEFPNQKLDDVSVALPSGWKVSALPPEQSRPGRVVQYTLKVERDGDKLHWTRMLDVNFLILDTDYYSSLRDFFQQVKTSDEGQIVLQPAAAKASN
jgi:hypothetical protein